MHANSTYEQEQGNNMFLSVAGTSALRNAICDVGFPRIKTIRAPQTYFAFSELFPLAESDRVRTQNLGRGGNRSGKQFFFKLVRVRRGPSVPRRVSGLPRARASHEKPLPRLARVICVTLTRVLTPQRRFSSRFMSALTSPRLASSRRPRCLA